MSETVSDDEFIKAIQGIGDFDTEEDRCEAANGHLETNEYYFMEPEARIRFIDRLIRIIKKSTDKALKKGMRAIACRIIKDSKDEQEVKKARELCEAAGGSNVVAVVGTLRPANKDTEV